MWPRVYAISTWALIIYFALMTAAHIVLTVLFHLGIWDTGVGYVFDYQWPVWLIALLDGSAAYLMWAGYKRGVARPWFGLAATLVASMIMVARASWFVIIPVLIVLSVAGSIGRVVQNQRAHASLT